MIRSSLILAILLGYTAAARVEDPRVAVIPALAGAEDPSLVEGSFRVERGDREVIWVPPGEHLEFEVDVDLGPLGDATVGTVTMSSGVEPFVASLPKPGESLPSGGAYVGWVKITAYGGHLGYELDHSITTRYLPQDWPSMIYAEDQSGTEHRKREVKIGRGDDGQWKSTYRGNSHCTGCSRREHFVEASLPWNKDHHCKKCKRGEHRLWDVALEREVPGETVDILSAVYLARSLVRGENDELLVDMLQKEDLWIVKLKRGEVRDIEVPAGTFRCRQVRLEVAQPEGESAGSKKFSGLFGIKGALQIWLHEKTGVPVLIEGDVPLGDIIDLHASIRLKQSRGTPPAFSAVVK